MSQLPVPRSSCLFQFWYILFLGRTLCEEDQVTKIVDKHDYSVRAGVENLKLFGNGQFDYNTKI